MAELDNSRALVSVVILEKDVNGDVLGVWNYPEVETEVEEIIILRSGLRETTLPAPFSYSKYKNDWIYILVLPISNSAPPPKLKSTSVYAIALICTDFNPEKYANFLQLAGKLYGATGDPPKVLELWLSVLNKGSYNAGEIGSFSSSGKEYDPRKAFLVTSIKDVIKLFGEEIILIWSALIMKKRIAILSSKLSTLLKLIRALPILVWHRQNWSILRPYTALSDAEISDLKSTGVYCAGFTDESIRAREDLYDIFVDVNERSVSVASHAKADFLMTPIHKDVCKYLVTTADNAESSDQEIIKGLTLKIKDLLAKLETLKVEGEDGNSYIDYKTLQNTKLPPNMDRFLYAVATAEGMTK